MAGGACVRLTNGVCLTASAAAHAHPSVRAFLHGWGIRTCQRSRDDPRACTFTLTRKSAMTTKDSMMPTDARRRAQLCQPTPLQYFTAACWGVLLVLCVGAEALKTLLG